MSKLGFRHHGPPLRPDLYPPTRDDVRLSIMDAAMRAPVGREKAVLVALASAAPRIILSLATIAERSGLGESTVRRQIETLEAGGFVQVYEQDPVTENWTPRPPAGQRKRARRRLAFVLHLPDGTRTRSTRHPDDHHGLSSIGEGDAVTERSLPERSARVSVHC